MSAKPDRRPVLVVDDDPDAAEAVRRLLAGFGWECRVAGSVAEALAGLKAGALSAVVLDLRLSDGDAWPVLEAAADPGLRIPVVMVTGAGDEAVAAEAVQRGAAAYLIKDAGVWDRLPAVLERVVAAAESERQFRAVFETALDAIVIADDQGRFVSANPSACELFGTELPELLTRRIADYVVVDEPAQLQRIWEDFRSAGAQSGEVRIRRPDGTARDAEYRAVSGVLPGRNVSVLRDVTERRRSQEAVRRQVARLDALRTIDVAITGSVDQRVTLHVVLDQAVAQLGVDAAAVLLRNPASGLLEFAAGRGFRTSGLRQVRIRPGEGAAGRALLDRQTIHIPDMRVPGSGYVRQPPREEGFVSCWAAPLIAKGRSLGVLEVYQRGRREPDGEWLAFLETLAGQAAIAVDNAAMFSDLQRTNSELLLAYDQTLEGWTKALDLRDKETEGHTRRVTEMTERLARAAGIDEAEMVHVRRGAMLHDIGKMAIPDAILLKPGPLTAQEWEVMRRHPQYAYDMLSDIPHLRPALDIPYCHHERWDGGGYPRGLRGEQIPAAARLFAVSDVWDALCSNRPYRAAWPAERVRAHIASLAGTHLDPAAVETFLRLEPAVAG